MPSPGNSGSLTPVQVRGLKNLFAPVNDPFVPKMNFLFCRTVGALNFSLSSAKTISQFKGIVAKLGLVGFYLKTLQKAGIYCVNRGKQGMFVGWTGKGCAVPKSFPKFHVLQELGIDGSWGLCLDSSSNILAKNQEWILSQKLSPEIKNWNICLQLKYQFNLNMFAA